MSQVRAYDMLIYTSYEAASMCCSEGYLLEAWVLFNKALEFPTTFQNLTPMSLSGWSGTKIPNHILRTARSMES